MNDQRDTILIADDMEVNRVILSGAFDKDYNLLEAENGEQAMLLIQQYHSRLAAILLDVMMPVKDGYQVMSEINAHGWLAEFPVIVITAENSAENEMRAFDMGASDIIVKPFELHVVRRRVENIIELNRHKLHQDELIEEQAKKLRESNSVMIDALSSIIEYRSVETGKHIQRIGAFTKVLLEDVARCYPEYLLDERNIAIIVSASALHDIGKIAIPDAILNKPGRLTPEEYEIMKTHSVRGCEMLAGLDRMGDREYLQYAYNICRYHHERWDGRGYPDGLKCDNIPLCAQVVGIADCYDALTNDRVYKKALPPEQAINMILNGECGAFSPRLLEIMKDVQRVLMRLSAEYADAAETPVWENQLQPAGADLPKSDTFDTLQMGQMKYFTLLKYIDATVMEVDFTTGLYHLVYLSGEDFALLKSGSTFRESFKNFAAHALHPDDREDILAHTDEYVDTLFDEGLMKRVRRYRIFSNKLSGYCWCEATIMRVDTGSPRQRKVLIAWKEDGCSVSLKQQKREIDESLLQNVIECVQIFHNDKWYTMDEPCEGICKLVGYTGEELRDKFQNRYVGLIFPADRENVVRQICEQSRTGKVIELEYRLMPKEGEPIWVLDKSRIFTGEDGREYFSTILINVTQTRRIQDELHFLSERYQIIMNQTNDIICEWDAKKDQIIFSSNWVKKFGYEPIREQASKRVQQASHIHPEDMPLFNRLFSDIRGGLPYEEMDIRFADEAGRYRWCKIRVAAQFDGMGELFKAVGVITDIDADKRASQELRSKAERDSLTMLYNRRTASQKIEEIIHQSEEGERAAMLIIDVDDFKLINDVYGHMFGDVVLQEIASELQKIFRSGDVVARVGGDEFLVFMRGVRDESIVSERAEKINETFRTVLSQNMEGKMPSCCVGISFYPENGTNYDELFRHSDLALYHAKARGKKNCEIYDQTMERAFGTAQALPVASTEIDSERMQEGVRQTPIIDQVFRILYETDNTCSAISGILEMAGREFGVSRAYIFEDDGSGTALNNTYEWCNEGIQPAADELKRIPYCKDEADYRDLFSERDIFYCPDISALPKWETEMFSAMHIKSMLQCAIRENGVFKGFIGFDDCIIRRIWTKNQIDTLALIAHLLSTFLLKRRAQERFSADAANISAVLDAQSDWVVVIDPADYRILYRNRAALLTPLKVETGMRCYGARAGAQQPCADCPMDKLRDEQQYVEEPLPNGKKFSCLARSIEWDGRRVCLLTGRLKGDEPV